MPKKGVQKSVINQERYVLKENNSYQYSMILKTKQKGWAKIVIGECEDELLKIQYINTVKFVNGSFFIE